MKLEIDVLIIFSSHDNDAPDKGESGWVSQFKRFLELMLTQVLGEKPNILLKDEVDSQLAGMEGPLQATALAQERLDEAIRLLAICIASYQQAKHEAGKA